MSAENRCTEEELETWLVPVLEKEGLENYEITILGNSEKGDGYLGDITFIDVTGYDKEKKPKAYNFVVKCGKKSTQLRDVMPIRLAFENEIHFYNEILPTFMKFQEEKGIKEPFNNFPKCYGTFIVDDMEVLVLDNLKFRNFSVHNRQQPMSKDHILKVIRTYGKLHAISYALKDQKPELFKQLAAPLGDVILEFSKLSPPDRSKNPFEDVEKVAIKNKENDIAEKARSLKEKALDAYKITDPEDPYAIILHGDCWNNNFMFKYSDENQSNLEDLSLIDFQISRLASPIYDLSYFLCTCLSPDDVKDFDDIVQEYYDSLCNFLKLLGSDPNTVFPFEELMNQWRKFYIFGFVMMPGIIKICLSEPDELLSLSEVAESNKSFEEAFSFTVKNIDEYGRRTLSIMRLFIDKKFI